jgi:Trypsin-co-occurring domain 1
VESFVEVSLPDGGSLIVEGDSGQSVVQAGRGRRVSEFVEETFESALDRVTRAAEAVHRRVVAAQTPPDEVIVEFAINLASEIGVVVANGSASANLKLVMRWAASDESQ